MTLIIFLLIKRIVQIMSKSAILAAFVSSRPGVFAGECIINVAGCQSTIDLVLNTSWFSSVEPCCELFWELLMRAVQNCRPNDNVEPGNNEWRYFRAMANHSQALQAVFMLLRDHTDAQPVKRFKRWRGMGQGPSCRRDGGTFLLKFWTRGHTISFVSPIFCDKK